MRHAFLPYCNPAIEPDDVAAVVDSMKHGWLTTGPNVAAFERAFAQASGVKHAIALNSCTAGLHVALAALGVGPGDEVVMPSLSFVAGAHCARHLGARPVFCDVDAATLCVTPECIDAVVTARTKAIMPMHYGGQPAGIDAIMRYARPRGIAVVEDAAHAAGTLDDGRWPGALSDAAVYSFYATKNMTTAEGGMLVTNTDVIAERARLLVLHGMDHDAWKRYEQGGTWRYDVPVAGYKYNMPDMAGALGLSQLKKLVRLQNRREELAQLYHQGLSPVVGVRPVATPLQGNNRHSWCVFAIAVDEEQAGISRDDVITALRSRNVGTSVHFIPTHTFSSYRDEQASRLPTTETIWRQLISLPLYPSMSVDDVAYVVSSIRSIVDRGSMPRGRAAMR